MKLPPTRSVYAVALAALVGSIDTSAQTVWDGGGNANSSGNWSVGTNWSTDAVPSAVAVQLNDVTSGTRTVTIDASVSSITSLSMTQTTTDGINRLLLSGGTLALTGTSPFSATLGAGVNVDALRIELSGGSVLSLSSSDNSDAAGTFNNTGTLVLSDTSELRRNRGDATIVTFTVNNTGLISMSGTGVGSVIGNNINADRRHNVVVNNQGQFEVTSGTGIIGLANLPGGNARGNATLNNSGTVDIADGAILQIRSKSAGGFGRNSILENEAGGTINVGDGVSGQLIFRYDYNTGTATAGTQRLTNEGAFNLTNGAVVALSNASAAIQTTWVVENKASGVFTIDGTGRVGSTDRITTFTNEGLLTKTGAGMGEIQSNTGGTFANTGALYVRDGVLSVTAAINSTGGDLRFDLGDADIVSARLLAPALTLSGSTLELVFTSGLTGERSYNLWDATVSGGFDSISLSGSGFGGTFTSAAFSSNGYNFSLNTADGVLTATVIPEPSAFAGLAGLGVLGLALVRRRRRG